MIQEKKTKKISRRDAIKLLGAATGATILANLPTKWNTPEIASGVLPAHAQTSSVLHTLACGTDAINVSAPVTSTVTISPATSGISMTYIVTTDGVVILSPSPATGTVLTDGSGVATLSGIDSDGTFVNVAWSFTNPSDGTGNCDQNFFYAIF